MSKPGVDKGGYGVLGGRTKWVELTHPQEHVLALRSSAGVGQVCDSQGTRLNVEDQVADVETLQRVLVIANIDLQLENIQS